MLRIRSWLGYRRWKRGSGGRILRLFFCLVLLFLLLKNCNARRENRFDYALDTVSRDFSPLVTSVLQRQKTENSINTQLLYAAYMTLFDNRAYDDKAEVRRRLIRSFYTEGKDGPVPVSDTDQIFNSIQAEFSVTVDGGLRREIVNLSKELAPGYLNAADILRKNLKSGDGAKNNIGLVNFAWNALFCKSGYIYGAAGQTVDRGFLERQKTRFAGVERAGLSKEQCDSILLRFGGRPSFDCGGLIKAYSWLDESTGEIVRDRPDAIPDCTANDLYALAQVKGNISEMPETPGLGVHKDGHVGIYIGGDEVIEAEGSAYGVVKTRLWGRGWEHYFRVPKITYVQNGTYLIHNRKITLYDGKIAG